MSRQSTKAAPAVAAEEWAPIIPDRGKRVDHDSVRVSWNKRAGKDHVLCVRIGPKLCTRLGWERGNLLLAQHHGPTNRLRLERAPPKTKGWGLHCNRAHSMVVRIPLPGLKLRENQRARVCRKAVEGAALIITLPDWAWLPSFARAREAADMARLATFAEERLRRVV